MELLPPIAAGRLEKHSVAELVASAFVANATGTVVVEQGPVESRLFVRYGQPCGVQLSSGEVSLGEVLVEQGEVDASAWQRAEQAARAARSTAGEVLVAEGALTRQRLERGLATQQLRNLFLLCMTREGRYELRGWERPPPWTERVSLDPLRLLMDVFHADAMADRRDALLDLVGDRRLRRAPDFDSQVSRLALQPLERRALGTLTVPRRLDEIGGGLFDPEEARLLGCASLLLGLLEVEEAELRHAPRRNEAVDASAFLRPETAATVTIPRPSRPPAPAVTIDRPLVKPAQADAPTPSMTIDRPMVRPALFDVPPEPAPAAVSFANGLELDLGDGDDEPLELDLDFVPGSQPAPPVTAKPAARPPPVEAYNPFAAPRQSSGRPPPGPAVILDSALDQIVRDSTPPRSAVTSTTGEDLFAGLDDLVADLASEPTTGPISLMDEPTPAAGDDLALAAAMESLAAEEMALDDDSPFDVSSEPVVERSQPVERSPGPGGRSDARKRLLQRAFRNVGGEAFRRVTGPIATSPSTPAPAPTAPLGKPDPAFEREVNELLTLRREDHFKRLGVAREASTQEIKTAFLQLAKRFHPDSLGATGQLQMLPQVREVFAMVKDSYDALLDSAARMRYLAELDAKEGAHKRAERDPEGARKAFATAQRYINRMDFVRAEPELSRAVALDPQSLYLAELAWAFYKTRKDSALEEIRQLVQRSLELRPVHDRACVVAAYIARVDGDDQRSENLFRQALQLNPANVEASREILLIEGRRKKAGLFDRLRGK